MFFLCVRPKSIVKEFNYFPLKSSLIRKQRKRLISSTTPLRINVSKRAAWLSNFLFLGGFVNAIFLPFLFQLKCPRQRLGELCQRFSLPSSFKGEVFQFSTSSRSNTSRRVIFQLINRLFKTMLL